MAKTNVTTGKKIWPVERKLINRIITKQKGYHNKPYPAKNKIPTKALHSIGGALNILDQAEKKKPNKGHIRNYRKTYEHKNALPDAHYFAYKKDEATAAKKERKAPVKKEGSGMVTAKELKKMSQADKLAISEERGGLSSFTKAKMTETPEQRRERLQKSLQEARKNFIFIDPSELNMSPAEAVRQRFPKRSAEDVAMATKFGGRF